MWVHVSEDRRRGVMHTWTACVDGEFSISEFGWLLEKTFEGKRDGSSEGSTGGSSGRKHIGD